MVLSDVCVDVPAEQMPIRIFTCEACLAPIAIAFTADREYDASIKWLQLIVLAWRLPLFLVVPGGATTAVVLPVDPQRFTAEPDGPEITRAQFAALIAELRAAHECTHTSGRSYLTEIFTQSRTMLGADRTTAPDA